MGIALAILGRNVVEVEKNAVGRVRESAQIRAMTLFRHKYKRKDESKKILQRNTESNDSANGHVVAQDSSSTVQRFDPPQHKVPRTLSLIGDLLITQLPSLALIILLALFIGQREGWTPLTSLYYCAMTTTTVGLGDVSPTSRSSRLLAVLFIPLSVAFLGELLGQVAGLFIDREAAVTEKEFLDREVTDEDLALMDVNGDGDVDFGEFLVFMMVTMGKVDRETTDELRDLFHYLDAQSREWSAAKERS